MLITEKEQCTGCTACMNICPQNAIKMIPDCDGFLYPEVDMKKCIFCRQCFKVCPENQRNKLTRLQTIPDTYVAIHKNKDVLSKSSSGGVFVAIATYVLNNNGVVCGCSWEDGLSAEHIFIDNFEDLKKLQGSKYVQSNIQQTYTKTKEYLEQGMLVFYTGTPCQISGLKSFLGKNYNNLITADLICHGVPNQIFFKRYLKNLEKKLNGKIINVEFRDKSFGWRFVGKAVYMKGGKLYQKKIMPIDSYYYNYFLKGYIYRESCYICKYAGVNRQGDFTIGDYWGVEKYHPNIDTQNGVSVFLINSDKGNALLPKLEEYLELTPSNFQKAKANNAQLNEPIEKNPKRADIFQLWREGGSELLAEKYSVSLKEKIMGFLKEILPHGFKKKLKRFFSK